MTEEEILTAGFVKADDFMQPYQRLIIDEDDNDDNPYLFVMQLDPVLFGVYLVGGTIIYLRPGTSLDQSIAFADMIHIIDPG